METLFLFVLYLSLFAIAFFCIRNTPLEISFKRSGFAGLLLYREIFGLILLATLLLSHFGPDQFHGFFNTKKEATFKISLIVYLSIFVFIVVSGVSLKVLFYKLWRRKKVLGDEIFYRVSNADNTRLLYFSWSLFIIGIATILIGIIVFDAKHAFLEALLSGGNIKTYRLDNRYVSSMPSVFGSLIQFCYLLLAVVLGASFFVKNKISYTILFMGALLMAGFFGSKGPIVGFFVLYMISLASFSKFNVSLKAVFKYFIAMAVVVFLLVFVITMQYGEMTSEQILMYLVNRLGVGQMAGLYEQFNLKIQDINYVLHSVPFANYLTDYPVFQKDLMVLSESVKNPESTGVKNSLFISEAYAFGGLYFSLLSPFIVGISYALSLYAVYRIVNFFIIKNSFLSAKVTGLYFVSNFALTGGMSDWLFFKAVIMVVIFFVPVVFIYNVVGGLARFKFH